MDKDYLLKITINLYRLTILFPKKEPLRYKIREVGDRILANGLTILMGKEHQSRKVILDFKHDLEIINAYLELSQSQNWVSPFDVLEIQKEYANIKRATEGLAVPEVKTRFQKGGELDSFRPENKESIVQKPEAESLEPGKRTRHQKIIEILREKDKIQVGELKTIFSNVSKRTLRRDFEYLSNKGIVERLGEKSTTFYRLKA